MTTVGYIWVNPIEHNGEFQRDLLSERGATKFFEDESANIAASARPALTEVLDYIDAGDTLVVWRLDRLGSTLPHVLSLLELLGRRGVGVASVTEQLDTSGESGASLLTIIGTFNELERTLTRERTMVGVYAARARGRVGGRPRALSPTNVERVLMLRDEGATVREIAGELGTSRATVYRVLEGANGTEAGDASERREAFGVRFASPGSEPLALGDR